MKKIILTIAVVIAMSFGASAQSRFFANDDANLDNDRDEDWGISAPLINGSNSDAPIGSGALLLLGFGVAYAACKQRKEDK